MSRWHFLYTDSLVSFTYWDMFDSNKCISEDSMWTNGQKSVSVQEDNLRP